MSRNRDLALVGYHILGWAIFIAYEVLYVHLMTGSIGNANAYFVNYPINILLFYFHAHVLMKQVYGRSFGQIVLAVALTGIEILIFLVIKHYINVLAFDFQLATADHEEVRKYVISNSMRFFYIIGFSTAYGFAFQSLLRNKKINELENERLSRQNEAILVQKDLLKAQNAFLRAQVNPHFLFNTLNFLYSSSIKVSEKLAGNIMILSEMMRYALIRTDADDKVPLEDEIQHIVNYISLNQARFDDALAVKLSVIGDPRGLPIIPLSLITLVENLFKYGHLMDPTEPATIRISIDAPNLEIILYNKKRDTSPPASHNIGIRNLKERLENYYPGLYRLDILDRQHDYQLNLSIQLN